MDVARIVRRGRAADLGRAWDNFDFQLTKHHEGEHEIAWPALVQVGVTQQTIDQMDAEHDVMAAALGDTVTAMTRFRTSASADDAAAAKAAFEQLRAVTVTHLDHEEAEVEPVYLANADHPAAKSCSGFVPAPAEPGGESRRSRRPSELRAAPLSRPPVVWVLPV